eukprot:CAMPEP_0204500496 /NCGR_PEP_ID=MMETSP0471-20130131/97320_1 /ASSEMBLY_ACC=CAM_ASM_000602 /TAXON_ID=2969 /ORGANISM="Oxyrrhis marina" /LENGTH=195 /DNA_ID=CAMNT_0051505121 /DNA_START=179 /DNA_END=763 /DNA_ORIENTATION=+
MLMAILPLSNIRPAVCPFQRALSMLLTIYKPTLVDSSVGVLHDTIALHGVAHPLAVKTSPVRPGVGAEPVHIVLVKLPFELTELAPSELALAVLHSSFEATLVHRAVRPSLDTTAILQVGHPFTVVAGALHFLLSVSCWANHGAFSMLHVIDILSVVDSAVSVGVLACPMPLIMAPLAFISPSLGLDQLAEAMPL